MKKWITAFYKAMLCLFLAPFALHAQWVQTAGPNAGYIQCLAVSGDTLFAGTDNGLFLSTNAGGNWIKASIGMTQRNVNTIAINNGTVYAGTDAGTSLGGIFASTDYANSWEPLYKTTFSKYTTQIAISGSSI